MTLTADASTQTDRSLLDWAEERVQQTQRDADQALLLAKAKEQTAQNAKRAQEVLTAVSAERLAYIKSEQDKAESALCKRKLDYMLDANHKYFDSDVTCDELKAAMMKHEISKHQDVIDIIVAVASKRYEMREELLIKAKHLQYLADRASRSYVALKAALCMWQDTVQDVFWQEDNEFDDATIARLLPAMLYHVAVAKKQFFDQFDKFFALKDELISDGVQPYVAWTYSNFAFNNKEWWAANTWYQINSTLHIEEHTHAYDVPEDMEDPSPTEVLGTVLARLFPQHAEHPGDAIKGMWVQACMLTDICKTGNASPWHGACNLSGEGFCVMQFTS